MTLNFPGLHMNGIWELGVYLRELGIHYHWLVGL